jgi:hypothetical protein
MRRYRKHVVVYVFVVVAACRRRVCSTRGRPPPPSASDVAAMCARPNAVCLVATATSRK